MITQGKWHNVCDSGSHKVDIMTDEGTYICTCAGTKNGLDISCEEDEANARLIAAAPELLAACWDGLYQLCRLLDWAELQVESTWDEEREAIHTLQEALKAAKGV